MYVVVTMTQTVIDTGSKYLTVNVSESAEVCKGERPLWPQAGNYIQYCVRVSKDECEYYEVRSNWNGTGRWTHFKYNLSPQEAATVYEKIYNVSKFSDFTNIVSYVLEIKRKIEEA